MRNACLPISILVVVGLLVAACASPTSSVPIVTPSGPPEPTGALASPPLSPSPASATLPIRGSAREFSTHVVVTAPGPGGGLYVLIPSRAAPAILALLDSNGRPAAGWPVVLEGAAFCEQLLPVEDGSVRAVCTLDNPDGNMFSPMGAFAFDANGRALAGWPVDLEGSYVTGSVVGDELTLFTHWPLGDVVEAGQPTYEAGIVTVATDGALRSGVRVPMGQTCCGDVWAIGPDGVAYGVVPATPDPSSQAPASWITALDLSGVRAGWPVKVDDIASGPAFGPDGRIVLTVASSVQRTSRVLLVDRDGTVVAGSSTALPIATVDEFTGETGGCVTGSPEEPLVAQDGTIFVYGDVDTAVLSLDPSPGVMPGWPFEPATPLVRARPGFESDHEAGYCPAPVVPAVGPDSTLYLPLQAPDASVGGSLVAVDPDGRVRSGWSVDLKRPGAEFWSVLVGSGGTVFALAIEPEAGDASSPTILAIAPDSTVLHTTTIIEP